MRNILLILFFIVWFKPIDGQSDFQVKPVSFNSGLSDEFSPVFFKGGIVFCSNQSNSSFIKYGEKRFRTFKMFYVTKKDSLKWGNPQVFAKEVASDVNDGPVTFNEQGNVMYFSRNNSVDQHFKNANDTSNKLGLYSAELVNGTWSNVTPFKYQNPLYIYSTPALSPDGTRIYFSSDMPGGSGGLDLYYCENRNNDWDKPINLGQSINTSGNESFPFVDKSGKLFFSSNGHGGYGGKDIFYTLQVNGKWIIPIRLDSIINSPFDDFGLVTDSTFQNGFFSSNRRKTDDIYSFQLVPVSFPVGDTIQEDNYCFTFFDERQGIDTAQVIYQWDFGDGIVRIGPEVKHCFSGPGTYSVKLKIKDKITDSYISSMVNYDVELDKTEQAYINSYHTGVVNKPIPFDAGKSNLKNFRISEYYWNFGDGYRRGSQLVNHQFSKKGEYLVQLGLIGTDSLGRMSKKSVTKKIGIFDTYSELPMKNERDVKGLSNNGNTDELNKRKMQIRVSLMGDLTTFQKENIEKCFKEFVNQAIEFDNMGISPSSFPILNKLIELINRENDVSIEMAIHVVKPEKQGNLELSEKLARELSFYFKNKEFNNHLYIIKGYGMSQPLFKPVNHQEKSDGIIELMFIKK